MPHSHSIYDTDKHFLIDPSTRSITALSDKLTLIQYDHNCERYTFEIPRMIEGHDMSDCDSVEIHFDNISKDRKKTNHDFYTVVDLKVSEEDSSIVIFSWLISEAATQLVGKLRFSIHFECYDEDGTRTYGLNTAYFEKITISSGVSNTENLIIEHSDFVSRMELLAEQNKETIEGFAENYEQNVHYEETVQEVNATLKPLADTLSYMTYRKRDLVSSVDGETNPFLVIDEDTRKLIIPFNYRPKYNYNLQRFPYLEMEIIFYFESTYTYGAPVRQRIKIPLDNLVWNEYSNVAENAASGIICFSEPIGEVYTIANLSDDDKEVVLKSLLSPSLVLINHDEGYWYLSFENDNVYDLIKNNCFSSNTTEIEASLYEVEYYTPKELSDALDIISGEVI